MTNDKWLIKLIKTQKENPKDEAIDVGLTGNGARDISWQLNSGQ
jgi:hypothetical protein